MIEINALLATSGKKIFAVTVYNKEGNFARIDGPALCKQM